MEARAYLKYLRISPRKVVILCDIVDLTVAVQHVVRIADLDPNLRRSCDQIAT